jgi:hypothetical protein
MFQMKSKLSVAGFMAATRRAFVGDGMACNWALHEKHFSRFAPILDFVHALCLLYHAAPRGHPLS